MEYNFIMQDNQGNVLAQKVGQNYTEQEVIQAVNLAVMANDRLWRAAAGALYSTVTLSGMVGLLSQETRDFLHKKGLTFQELPGCRFPPEGEIK